MEQSRIVVIADSVLDGSIGIEQVWQSYGNMIRSTTHTETEQEAMALVGLYLRYGTYLRDAGYLKEAKSFMEESLQILYREQKQFSEHQFLNAKEAILFASAVVNSKLDHDRTALAYLKELRQMFPGKDEYKQAYVSCMASLISKYTTPIYIILGVLFLLKMGEIYLFHTDYIPGWLIDAGWVLWIVMLIVQFGLPWIMKHFTK